MENLTIIDVSEHQGKINWKKVKPCVDAAIIRTGYGDDIQSQDDKYAVYNMDQCEKLGIPYGAYLYSYADSEKHIQSEIDHEKRMTKNRSVVSHWYDLEEWGLRKWNRKQSEAWIKEFDSSGIYAGQAFWKDPLKGFECRRWIPAYGTNNGEMQEKFRPVFEFEGWQYTSRKHFPGISGNVDTSVWVVPFYNKEETKEQTGEVQIVVRRYRVKKKEVAAFIMRDMCIHNKHGYTQDMDKRWGTGTEYVDVYGVKFKIAGGDRDCSSAVISAFEAAGISCGGATYTGNMVSCMVKTGNFKKRPMSFTAGMSDVYLNEKYHTAMCLSSEPDVLMEFSINEKGTANGGKQGDQLQNGEYDERLGKGESHLKEYYEYPWNCILECTNDEVAFEIEYEVEIKDGKETVISERIIEVENGKSVAVKSVTPDVVMDVFKNKYGKGATDGSQRFVNLKNAGYDPVEVQSKVNWVYAVARGLLDADKELLKKYGNGKNRKKTLGEWYGVVQKEINVLAGIDKWE